MLFVFQELHDAEVKSWFLSFSVVSSAGSNKSCGLAVLLSQIFRLLTLFLIRLDILFVPICSAMGARLKSFHCMTQTYGLIELLFSISAPPLGVPTLLCADFNSVIHPSLDCMNAGVYSNTDTPR